MASGCVLAVWEILTHIHTRTHKLLEARDHSPIPLSACLEPVWELHSSLPNGGFGPPDRDSLGKFGDDHTNWQQGLGTEPAPGSEQEAPEEGLALD